MIFGSLLIVNTLTLIEYLSISITSFEKLSSNQLVIDYRDLHRLFLFFFFFM